MDNTFQKIGVIDYKKSKYATLFMVGSFIFFISIGAVLIALSGSADSNIVKNPWLLLGCL